MKKLVSLIIVMSCIFSLSAQWHFHNPLPQGNTLRDIYFFDVNNGLAVGDGGTLLKTSDGGLSWEFVNIPSKNDLYAITFIESHIGFICGSAGTILRTSDSGESWEEMTSGTTVTLRDIHFAGSPRGLAVGDNGTILITYDCGFSWNALSSITTSTLHSLYCLSPMKAFAVGDNGTILTTFNGGAQWEVQQSSTSESLFKVIFKNEYRGWITGNAGIILKTVNAGESWLIKESGTQAGLYGICMCDEEKVWAVGQNGTILYTTDGGSKWTSQVSDSDRSLNTVFAVNDQNCFVAGDNGDQFLTTDGGQSWISKSTGFHDPVNLRFAGFTDDLHGWAADDGSQIVHTGDGGITWTVYGTIPWGPDILFTDPYKGWSIQHHNDFCSELLITNDGGITWDSNYYNCTMDYRDYYTSIVFINPDTGWVAGTYYDFAGFLIPEKYLILKTSNGGLTWSRKIISAMPYCDYVELYDLFFIDGLHGWAIGWAMGIGAYDMYILKTSNGGASWSRVMTNLWNFFDWSESSRIFFVNYEIGYAIDGHSGTLYKSIDGGATWSDVNPGSFPSLQDIFFSDPENGWVIGRNGAIFHTTDAGINWTHEKSLTGYDLNRILFTPNGDGWIFGDNSTILHLADSTLVSVKEPVNPGSLSVFAFPNPFTGSISISYNLNEECHVNLIVYNYTGQMISELVNERQSKGDQQSIWNGENLPSGIYFYRLIAGNLTASGKVEKLK
jgi:photosystem II stability/assembly factor-like uncharacterized protein